jgi:hypothetical protein
VIDLATLKSWIEQPGFEVQIIDAATMRVRLKDEELVPSFIVQATENWVLLSILPVFPPGAVNIGNLGRRLLEANREIRLAKFGLDAAGAVVLSAELPTEALDPAEVAETVRRMVGYVRMPLAAS